MNERPLLDRLTPASHRALMIWCVTYALNNRNEIDPAALADMNKGTPAQRWAASILIGYGLDLTRETAAR